MFIIMCIMVGLVLDGLIVLSNDNPRTELDGFTSHICTHTPEHEAVTLPNMSYKTSYTTSWNCMTIFVIK